MEDIEKHLALLDSNVAVYALVKDFPSKKIHRKCLEFLEKALKGKIDLVLCLNPVMIIETYSTLAKLLGLSEAEYRVSSLLRSNRLAYVTASRSSCEKAVNWAKEALVPVNDAMLGSIAVEHSASVCTADEEHFRRLKRYGVTFRNPVK